MGVGSPGGSLSVAGGSLDMKTKKKYTLGGMMNPEEARMNRALLQEISRAKRGEEPSDLLQIATQNPIWV